jgi:hypothetical protein
MAATLEVNDGAGAVVVEGVDGVGSDVVGRGFTPLPPVVVLSGAQVAAVARRQTATSSKRRTSLSVGR